MDAEQKAIVEKVFKPEIRAGADALVAKYETKRASILMILRLLQEHYGHVDIDAQRATAYYLELPEIQVCEVMSFYTLFYDQPRAKTQFHVCRTLTCSLAGGKETLSCLEKKLGIKSGEMTPDGKYSIDEVECLGACEIAPMLQVNTGDFVGNLTPEKIDELVEKAENGQIEELNKGEKTPMTLFEEK